MNNKNKSSNQISYPLRIIAGIYLIYLAYSLVKTWGQLDNKLLFGVFIGIFGIVGVLLLVTSALGYLRSRNAEASGTDTPDSSTEEGKDEPQSEISDSEVNHEKNQEINQESDNQENQD